MLEISRASYYKWLNRKPAQYETRDQTLMSMMLDTYNALDGIYGYRRMTIYLNHYRQAKVNHKHVYRLMQVMNLKSVIRKKKRRYKTVKPDYIAANILNREFHAAKPMQKLVTDITEFSTTDGRKVYLSAVLDLCTNKIIAHHMDIHSEQSLVTQTFKQIESQIIGRQTIIHTDRGSQYTSHAFHHFIKHTQSIHSMSRPGKCIDNGPIENVWGIIKSEKYYLNSYDTVEALKEDINAYIKFYNTQRVTLKMGLKIPA